MIAIDPALYRQFCALCAEQGADLDAAANEAIRFAVQNASVFPFELAAAQRERELMLRHRAEILRREQNRLNGAPSYTLEEVDAMIEEMFHRHETASSS